MNLVFINKALILLFDGLVIPILFLIYSASRRSKVNLTFFLSIIFMILWFNFGYLAFSANEAARVIFWFRLNLAAVSLFFVPFYFFIVYFPKKTKDYPILNRLVPFIFLILSGTAVLTDFFVRGALVGKEGVKIILGDFVWVFYAVIFIFSLLSIGISVEKYIILSGTERLKVFYFWIAGTVFALSNFIFCVILPFCFDNFKYTQLSGVTSAIIAASLISYTILKKELFGVKVVLTQLLVLLIAVLGFLDFVFTEDFYLRTLKGVVFFLFLGFGYLLIKSVLGEIREREKFQKLSLTLEDKVRERTRDLEEMKAVLEIKVKARTRQLREQADFLRRENERKTKDLRKRLEELERFHRATVGRELKMIELKKELRKLKEELNRYKEKLSKYEKEKKLK